MVSARIPWPAKAASPWTSSGRYFFAPSFASAVLLGAGAADGDGIDGFQMAGIGDQVDVNLAAAAVTYSPVAPM